MKTIILININENPRELVLKLGNILSYYNTEYCMRSEKLEVYLEDLLVKMRHIKINNGMLATNKDLKIERNLSEINMFKNHNKIKIIIIK